MKLSSHLFTYEHPWDIVTQGIYRKYPNPFSRHVASSDMIEWTVDKERGDCCPLNYLYLSIIYLCLFVGLMTTTRLLLKKGPLPTWGKAVRDWPYKSFIKCNLGCS